MTAMLAVRATLRRELSGLRADLIEHEVATLERHDPLMAVLAGKLAARRDTHQPNRARSPTGASSDGNSQVRLRDNFDSVTPPSWST